ncbi:ribosomal protein S12 methylthiotransferase accessory factor [Pseudacidovorax sp. 1753]|uniref:YcaO-like family protein n=1 Tax=Pseudacidovorax sp. 1753 TaxID=3156419 RepID=UPI0033966258
MREGYSPPLRLCEVVSRDNSNLVFRTSTDEVEVKAPSAVLSALLECCDGTLSLRRLEEEIGNKYPWDPLGRFLEHLLAQGVLEEIRVPRSTSLSASHSGGAGQPVKAGFMDVELPPAVRSLGLNAAQAVIDVPEIGLIRGFGRAKNSSLALVIALSEAAERMAYSLPSANLIEASVSDLGDSLIPPQSVASYTADQYRRSSLAIQPLDKQGIHQWIAATRFADGRSAWCHAELVYSAHALKKSPAMSALMWQTTSGCASDINFARAIERAGLEVIERDALARHWLSQRSALSLKLDSLPPDARELVLRGKKHQFEVDVGILTGLGGPVVVTACTSSALGICALSTSCANSLEASIEHSLGESLVIALTRASCDRKSRAIRPEECRRAIDHGDLYSQHLYFRRAHAISRGEVFLDYDKVRQFWPTSLAQRLDSYGLSDAAWVDITPPSAPLSTTGEAIKTARVIVPGLIPLVFGFDALPRATVAALHPHGLFPHPLP